MKVDEKLLRRYLEDRCLPEENEFVERWYANLQINSADSDKDMARIVRAVDRRISAMIRHKRPNVFLRWTASAAAILVLVGIVIFWPYKDQTSAPLADVAAPIGANTVIIFEDNTELDLDLLNSGDTVRTSHYLITRNEQGDIKYLASAPSDGTVIYNTVRTQAGGITSLVLDDGSKVWINAKSEVTYPISFSGGIREVALSGEAYFEIESRSDQPFYVRTDGHTLKVLGTKFNVNNKHNQYVSTLLEGKVGLAAVGTQLGDRTEPGFPFLLQPNQAFENNEVTATENAHKAIDWKEGYFDFSDMTVTEASLKLADWYDVTFDIEGSLHDKRIYGQINKDKSLRQVLELIGKVLPINYEINDKQIYIHSNHN